MNKSHKATQGLAPDDLIRLRKAVEVTMSLLINGPLLNKGLKMHLRFSERVTEVAAISEQPRDAVAE